VVVQAGGDLPAALTRRAICALSAIAHALMTSPQTLDEVAARVAPGAELDVTLAVRGARQIEEQLAEALAHDRTD
jgi:hypothetical protein